MANGRPASGAPRLLLSVALACGGVPLVVGVSIFLLWCATRWEGLEAAGFLSIVLGMMSVVAGAACLVGYFGYAIADGNYRRWTTWGWGIAAALLMFVNFPICRVIVTTVLEVMEGQRAQVALQRPRICVVNATSVHVEEIDLTGPPVSGVLGPIRPGEAVSYSLDRMVRDRVTAIRTIYDGKNYNVPPEPRDLVVLLEPERNVRVIPLTVTASYARD